MPRFSVVIATFNRGRHILPTLRSALAQTLDDFEVLVVGDGCTDDTGAVLEPWLGDRVRWLNLPRRGGSQSYPNNAGIEMARGGFVAYLGHDDIWAPDHLAALADVFDGPERPDFAASGCIYHTPEGTGFSWVTGFLEKSEAAALHFLPPSSSAHTIEAARAVGAWSVPDDILLPVDIDFQHRAVRRGMRFAATGRVTVHKFAAGHRYLSYVRQSSREQEAMLAKMAAPGFDAFVGDIVEEARHANTFMCLSMPDEPEYARKLKDFGKGDLYRRNASNKGVLKPDLKPLAGRTVLRQEKDSRALDWYPLRPKEPGLRWSGPNPRPRILLPFAGSDPVVCSMRVFHADPAVFSGLRIACDGKDLPVRVRPAMATPAGASARLAFSLDLKADDYTVLEIGQPASAIGRHPSGRNIGIAVGDIVLRPRRWHDRLPGRDVLAAVADAGARIAFRIAAAWRRPGAAKG